MQSACFHWLKTVWLGLRSGGCMRTPLLQYWSGLTKNYKCWSLPARRMKWRWRCKISGNTSWANCWLQMLIFECTQGLINSLLLSVPRAYLTYAAKYFDPVMSHINAYFSSLNRKVTGSVCFSFFSKWSLCSCFRRWAHGAFFSEGQSQGVQREPPSGFADVPTFLVRFVSCHFRQRCVVQPERFSWVYWNLLASPENGSLGLSRLRGLTAESFVCTCNFSLLSGPLSTSQCTK